MDSSDTVLETISYNIFEGEVWKCKTKVLKLTKSLELKKIYILPKEWFNNKNSLIGMLLQCNKNNVCI